MAVVMVMALSGCGEKIAADNPKLTSGQNVAAKKLDSSVAKMMEIGSLGRSSIDK